MGSSKPKRWLSVSRLLACSLLGHGIYNHVDLATDLASARICLLGTALGPPLILFLLG